MRPSCHIFVLMLLLSVSCITSCSKQGQQEALNRAESLMEAHPDSALTILKGIGKSELGTTKEKARYAILMSMALDKNYIDTTTFDVLQPAIDYYLKKGTPNEILRTYYYQGCIFLNRGDRDNALNSFVKGLDHISENVDSLCLARTFVAQAMLYGDFHDFNSYTNNYLKAANIYKHKGLKDLEFDCILNALNGSVVLNDKSRADSIINACNQFKPLTDVQNRILQGYRLSYAITFGSEEDLKNLIDSPKPSLGYDTNGLLNLAYAYNKLGDGLKAKIILDDLDSTAAKYDTIKYQSIKVSVLDSIGELDEAYSLYRDYILRLESINTLKFKQKAQIIEEKHKIELQAQTDDRKKSGIIWGCIGGIAILALGIFVLTLLVRSNKVKRDLALQKAKTTDEENKRLKSEKDLVLQKAMTAQLENEKLKTEREYFQLERDKKALEAENLAHRVEVLENESASLKELMDSQEELPTEVQHAIKVRIEMLNALMAGYITNNDQYEKPYESWIKELTDNTEEFMNSNRLAFQVSHPRFIQYFENHGLTVSEINYVCLYAIGLRGKEVGNYMKKRSHVNISSGIRKKLGIDKHETNIGIYVRKLLKEL